MNPMQVTLPLRIPVKRLRLRLALIAGGMMLAAWFYFWAQIHSLYDEQPRGSFEFRLASLQKWAFRKIKIGDSGAVWICLRPVTFLAFAAGIPLSEPFLQQGPPITVGKWKARESTSQYSLQNSTILERDLLVTRKQEIPGWRIHPARVTQVFRFGSNVGEQAGNDKKIGPDGSMSQWHPTRMALR